MNGTRFTTIISRFLAGVSGGFMAHAICESFRPYGLILSIVVVFFGLIVLLCFEGKTPKTKSEKSQGDSLAVFGQLQTILIVFAVIVGGWLRWVG